MHILNTSSDQDQLDHAIHRRSDYVLQLVTGPANVAMHQCSLVFCCDQFDHGSGQVKHDPVDLVMEDYCITLRWQIQVCLPSHL